MTLRGERVVLRPLEPGDLEVIRRIRSSDAVVKWWGRPDHDFPADDGDVRFAILVDGEVAGMLQYYEEPDPEARHADVDVFLDAVHHGQGHGTDDASGQWVDELAMDLVMLPGAPPA